MAQGWFKSRKSNCNGACVEVRFELPAVHIRDSKALVFALRPESVPTITVSLDAWSEFNRALAGADFATAGNLVAELVGDGGARLQCRATGTVLIYTGSEWDAFLDGVRAGEFAPVLVPA